MPKYKIFIYDLDNTLINCDSFIYFIFYIAKNKKILFLFKFIILLILFLFHFFSKSKTRTFSKSLFIQVLLWGFKKKQIIFICKKMVQEILLKSINKKLYRKIKKIKNKNKIFLITASLNIYVNILAKELDIKNVFSTKVSLKQKAFGKIIGKNCYGKEKERIILKKIKNFKNYISYFYTDCLSDTPLIKICSKSYLLK